MKKHLAEFLIWISEQLTYLADLLVPPMPLDSVRSRIKRLALLQENFPERSGEAKRYQVMKRLRDEFPDLETRKLSLLLELELQNEYYSR